MPRKPSPDRLNLLRTIHALRVADLELLRALCARPPQEGLRYGFGAHGVRYACDALLRAGYLHRLWKVRAPVFRMDRGSARQVFLISQKGAEFAGLPDSKAAEKWFEYLKNPRKSYVLEHELMIARFHGALRKLGGLEWWRQGKGTRIDGYNGFRLTPDAFFLWNGRHFFLEADTGTERVESDDENRRTIEGKIRRYGLADREGDPQDQFEIPGFSVVFMTPQRSDPQSQSGRERNILQACREYGQLRKHAPGFYGVVSETLVMRSLLESLPLSITPATLEGPAGGSSSSIPSQESAPTHEPA